MNRSPTLCLVVAVGLAGAVFTACDGHQIAGPPGPLASIAVTPHVTLAIKVQQQFIAVGRDAGGVVVAIAPTWSLAAGGGSISSTGLFTAGTEPGTFTSTVKASSGDVSGSASVTVTDGVVMDASVFTLP